MLQWHNPTSRSSLVFFSVQRFKALAFFFRPTPYGSRQVVKQAGKPVAYFKFSELMQWQHHYIDNVHQK